MKKKQEMESCLICGLESTVLPPPPTDGSPDCYALLRNIDGLVALKVVENILGKFIHPIPDRKTLISLIQQGIFTGTQFGKSDKWYIYHSSLDAFISSRQQKLAA